MAPWVTPELLGNRYCRLTSALLRNGIALDHPFAFVLTNFLHST